MSVGIYALCGLDDVRNYLHMPDAKVDDDMDTQLETLIDQMTEVFENYCDRQFLSREYVEYHNGDGGNTLYTTHYPITSVSGIWNDTGWDYGSDSLMSSDNYAVMGDYYIVAKNTYFTKYTRNIKIIYTAGYSTVPADVKLACVEEVARKWKNKNEIDVLAKTAEDGSITKYTKDLLPSTIRVLNRYVRLGAC